MNRFIITRSALGPTLTLCVLDKGSTYSVYTNDDEVLDLIVDILTRCDCKEMKKKLLERLKDD
jgi:hypothetical protein